MYKQDIKYYRQAYFIAFVMAALMFLPIVIMDKGIISYYGDFNEQQIHFYKACINAVHSGKPFWDWTTDLGVDLVGSYSFYTLGSPFFWLAAIFPASISHYLMAPLLVLKFATASLTACVYIRRFVKDPRAAVICGVLYAFSGYSLQNIFFNHFHDVLCLFPLLLIGLEEAVMNKRRGLFALTVAINALVNYFFFFGEVVFLIIYFILRISFSKDFRISVGDFFCLGFESLVGVAISAVLLYPSFLQVVGMDRTTDILLDWDFLFYNEDPQRTGLIFESPILPPEATAHNYLFPGSNARWSSTSLYLPLFSLSGIFAFIKSTKKNWIKVMLPLCLIMALVPGFNAAFTLFNNFFYTRWFYMPTLIGCLATAIALDRKDIDLVFGAKANIAVTAFFVLLVEFTPFCIKMESFNEYGEIVETNKYVPRIQYSGLNDVLIFMFLIGLVALPFMYKLAKSRDKLSADKFFKRTACFVIVACMATGYYTVLFGREMGREHGFVKNSIEADIKDAINDDSFYRIDSNFSVNYNMDWGYGSPQSFISTVPESVFDLHSAYIGERDVMSELSLYHIGFRAVTGTKYFITNEIYGEITDLGWRFFSALYDSEPYANEEDFTIYKAKYDTPMGYSYDTYITEEQLASLDKWLEAEVERKEKEMDEAFLSGEEYEYTVDVFSNILVRCAMLKDVDVEKYSDVVTPLPEDELYDLSLETFVKDIEKFSKSGVVDFTANGSEFVSHTNYDRDRLVVFGVPYADGWTATLNGEPVEIDVINSGFMGVKVPAGEQELVFSYESESVRIGAFITLCGLGALVLYWLFCRFVLRHRAKAYAHTYSIKDNESVSLHNRYIERLTERKTDPTE